LAGAAFGYDSATEIAIHAESDQMRQSGAATLLCLTLASLPPASADRAPFLAYEVVTSHPHDPAAFTQGLLYADGHLYESTGRYGESSVRRVELETGRVLASRPLPLWYFGEGLALVGDRLIQLSWKARRAFAYDFQSLASLGELRYSGEGWGLTFDGQRLYMSDGSASLTVRDPDSFAERARVEVTDGGRPVRGLNELEFIAGRIWANVYPSPLVAVIHPETGAVGAWLDLTRLHQAQGSAAGVANGIAHDASRDRIFVTGKHWNLVYQIRVAAAAPIDGSDGEATGQFPDRRPKGDASGL
jgi:glutamine cyclotransferase